VDRPQDEDLERLAHLEAVSLHCDRHFTTPELIARTHAAGCRLLAWTVNNPPEASRLLSWGADGIITDNLRQFAKRFPELL